MHSAASPTSPVVATSRSVLLSTSPRSPLSGREPFPPGAGSGLPPLPPPAYRSTRALPSPLAPVEPPVSCHLPPTRTRAPIRRATSSEPAVGARREPPTPPRRSLALASRAIGQQCVSSIQWQHQAHAVGPIGARSPQAGVVDAARRAVAPGTSRGRPSPRGFGGALLEHAQRARDSHMRAGPRKHCKTPVSPTTPN